MRSLFSDESLLSEIVRDGLTIDCKEIKLVQNTIDAPRIWIFTGSLDVDLRKGITARLVTFDEHRPELSILQPLMLSSTLKSGEIFPDSYYFSLTATDIDGNVWINPVVEVEEKSYANCAVVSLKCNWIRSVLLVTNESDSVRMLFLDELRFPLNSMKSTQVKDAGRSKQSLERAGSQGDTHDARILYLISDDSDYYKIDVAVNPGASFAKNYAYKLVETIRFLTSSSISFGISESICSGVKTIEFAKATSAGKGIFPPPLASKPQYAKDFYRLLDAYLTCALRSSNDEEFSPISAKLYPLYGPINIPFEASALLVSVIVEGFVQENFKTIGAASPSVRCEIDQIFAAIDVMSIEKSTRDRVKGSLGGMKSSRAPDKLYALEAEGKVSGVEIKAWKDLRNTVAHGSLHVTPEALQNLLDQIYIASTLLNKLVLLAIGYEGKYTDYSIKGWPESDFPPSVIHVSD